MQFKKKKISQMSAVRTGVRAYMDATPLIIKIACTERSCFESLLQQVSHKQTNNNYRYNSSKKKIMQSNLFLREVACSRDH